MKQFRVSKALIKHGISPEVQGLIFFVCLNVKRLKNPNVEKKILNVCISVAGGDYQALYTFLTNAHINHIFICNTYFISKARLFKLKKEFYIKFASDPEFIR